MEEVWKDIKNYEGIYQVSNLGKIKRLNILNDNGYRKAILQEKELKLFLGNTGYLMVNLYKDKKSCKKLVHRIVAETFINNINKVKYVNHIDSDKLNNNLSNLEWVSNIENNLHRFLEKDTSSSYSGVCWDKNKSKWRAYIFIKGKLKHLGYSEIEHEAYCLRVKYEQENNIINKYL